MNKLLAVFLISGAISLSKQAGSSSSSKSETPAVRDYPCNVVQDKKPWCSCSSSLSSDVIDLSSLGTEDGTSDVKASIHPPKFVSKEVDGWYIAWTPCEDFDMFTNITLNPDAGEKACKGVGFARYTETSGKICNGYGAHGSSAKFYSNGYGPETKDENFYIEFVFKAKTGQVRNARIWLRCTPDTNKSYLKYHGDKQGVEVAEFFSKCCCTNQQQCSSKVDPPGKRYHHLSEGATAGIVIGVIAVIALIVIPIVWYKRRHQDRHPVQVDGQEHDERLPIIFNRA